MEEKNVVDQNDDQPESPHADEFEVANRTADLKFSHKLGILGLSVFLLFGIVLLNKYFNEVHGHVGAVATPMVLKDQVSPYLQGAQIKGHAVANRIVHLSLGLKIQNEDVLNQFLNDLYDPSSVNYKKYLSSAEFSKMFGPSDAQIQLVKDYLKSSGFTNVWYSPNGMIINADGKVSVVESVFSVAINDYMTDSRTFFANGNAPVLPGDIASVVDSVSGLDNSVVMHHHARIGKVRAKPAAVSGQGGLTPTDITNAYDLKPLISAGFQGTNQTVALFELDGYNLNDIGQYAANFNLGTPSISTVLVDGFNGSAGQGAIEDELDVELVAGLAPNAKQIVYEGPNTTAGLNDTYNKIVTDNKAQVLTTSWGACEPNFSSSEITTLNNIFKQAAAQGITVYAAAGDTGAYDCRDTTLNVDVPTDSQYVTGVGGTSLTLSNGSYGSENVWSNPSDTFAGPKGSGGGGGLSKNFSQPSYQNGPGVKSSYSNGKREVPDVSANADPATGYAVYCTVTNSGCPSTGWITVGGTSAGSPFWAASTAIMNQYLTAQGASRLGFISPALYGLTNLTQLSQPFHDIKTGNNLYYPATNSYDLASGVGSPDVNNLVLDLKKHLVQPQAYQPNHLNNELKGVLDVYIYGSNGALWESSQAAPRGTWSTWTSLGSMSGPTPRRTTAVQQNGAQMLFMNSSDGSLWVKSETAANSNQWNPWSSMGKFGTTGFVNFPIVGVNADGRVEAFETGSNHVLYHNYQKTPNGAWSGWASLGTPSGVTLHSLAMATNSDGRLEIFITATDGKLWHMYQNAPNSGWSGWSSLGNPGNNLGSIIIGRNQDGRLEVFANGGNGILYHLYQTPGSSTGWSGWGQLSTQSGFSFNKFTSSYQGPIVGSDANGHFDLFEVGTDGNIWHNYQKAPNSAWGGWSNFGKPSGVNLTGITIHNDKNGDLVMVITGSDGNMWVNLQSTVNVGWSGWTKVAPLAGVNFGTVQ